MKTINFILLIIASLAVHSQINSEIQPYYDAFAADAALHNIDLNTRYTLSADFSGRNIGVMAQAKLNSPRAHAHLIINRVAWDTLSSEQRKIVVYHELGHALLFRPHQEYSLSIMNSNMISEANFIDNEQTLIKELFLPYNYPEFTFQYPLGYYNDSLTFNDGDLVLLIQEGTLKPFIVNVCDVNNPVHKLLNYYHIYIISVIDLTDKDKMMMLGKNRIIQINSTHGGVSVVQPDFYKAPIWDGRIIDQENDFLIFHLDFINNLSFDETPFKDIYGYNHMLSGDVRFDGRIFDLTKKVIVLSTKQLQL